jgi:uncharacterized protein (TIGR03083 family)
MDDDTTQTDLPPEPQSKAQLLELTRREYAALERALAGLSDRQMTDAPDGGWSVKDLLAHIAAWQQVLLRFHMGGQSFREAAPDITANYATDDVDTINEAFYRRDKDRPLAEVLDTFRRSHRQTLAAIEGMSEAELFRSYTPAGRDPSAGGRLANWIAGDTYEHYMEHRATIEQLIGRRTTNDE